MDIDKCIMAYSELMRTIFDNESSSLPFSWRFQIRSQFDSVKLKDAIKKVITSHLSESDLFNDKVERGCRVCVGSSAKTTLAVI